jgi:hypothetical protein
MKVIGGPKPLESVTGSILHLLAVQSSHEVLPTTFLLTALSRELAAKMLQFIGGFCNLLEDRDRQ